MLDLRVPLAAAMALLLATACTSTPTPTPTPTQAPPVTQGSPTADRCIESMTIRGGKFQPETLTIKVNCVVLFTNRDDTVEQVQGHDFLLGEIGKDQSWAHTYKEPGTFPISSTKTQTLKGTVRVQP